MRWLALWLGVLAQIVGTFAFAQAQVIPQACAELAHREQWSVPAILTDAKKAEAKVKLLAFFGDKLARRCRDAINAARPK